jgi:hypothetical protein
VKSFHLFIGDGRSAVAQFSPKHRVDWLYAVCGVVFVVVFFP